MLVKNFNNICAGWKVCFILLVYSGHQALIFYSMKALKLLDSSGLFLFVFLVFFRLKKGV